MYVAGSGIPERLITGLQAVAERFFALPLEEKMKVYIGRSSNHRGYVPEGEEVFAGGGKDRKEAYDLAADLPADDPDYLSGNPLLGPNQWPGVPGFAESAAAYYDAVFDLGRRLLRGFALALGKPAGFFDRHVTKPPTQLRLVHYPYDPGAGDRLGIGAHTDYECFTVLKPTAPGLEVLNGAGEWIDAPPVPGTFVIQRYGIEYIPEQDRGSSPRNLVAILTGGSLALSVIIIGAYPIAFGSASGPRRARSSPGRRPARRCSPPWA